MTTNTEVRFRFVANPVEVTAFRIDKILGSSGGPGKPETLSLLLENGEKVNATPEMCSRFRLVPGDFWVIQEDGYIYLNPKNVFERKYHPVLSKAAIPAAG